MKKLAIGCGIVLLLLAAVIAVLIYEAPRIAQSVKGFVKDAIKESAAKAKFEAEWQPPTPEPSEQWFPEEVAGWKRTTAEAFHEIPELTSPKLDDTPLPSGGGAGPGSGPGVDKDGYGATYMLNGQRIEVKVFAATDLEKEGLMARAHAFKPLLENAGSTSSFQSGHLLEMTFAGRERIYCRSFSAWVIFMHTLDGAEIKPFAESWLHAIDQQPLAPLEAPPDDAKPK